MTFRNIDRRRVTDEVHGDVVYDQVRLDTNALTVVLLKYQDGTWGVWWTDGPRTAVEYYSLLVDAERDIQATLKVEEALR